MKIERVELRELSVRLRFRFETSFGVEQEVRKLIVTVRSDGLEGYGEVTAGNEPGYSYETVDTAWVALESYIAPRVLGRDYATADELLRELGGIRGHNMAVAGLETALWDLLAKRADVPLWALLGGVERAIPVGASIGIQASADETVAQALRHAEEGYRRLKFKIKPGWDLEPLRAVRAALPEMALSVDANSAYRLTDARVLQGLDELGLDYIEQPLAHDDLLDHAKLQAMLTTPLCLDESVHSPDDARKALEVGAGRVINVKLGRVRGHLGARRVADVALAFGAPVWCGGMLELGIGRAHNLHMTSLAGFSLPGDTASASRYWDEDIVEPLLDAKDGLQALPQGPGVGVTLKPELVRRLTTRSVELTAGA